MRWFLLLLAWAAWGQSRESIEKQLNSVARQRETIRQAVAVRVPENSPSEDAAQECATMPPEKVSPLVESAAKAQRLPAKLLQAVIEQDSGFRSCAVSEKGAK